MTNYVISVWNNIATIFRVKEENEKLTYEKIELQKNKQTIQEFIDSLVANPEINKIYPLTQEVKEKLEKMGLKL